MSEKREMVCIMCPMGCNLTVEKEGETINVSGNGCMRGATFAKEEISCPKRIVTTSIKTAKGPKSCKTTHPIPKSMIFNVVQEIEKLNFKNVRYGQVVIKDVLGTGADVVVTANE